MNYEHEPLQEEANESTSSDQSADWARRRQAFREKEHAVAQAMLDQCQETFAEMLAKATPRDLLSALEMASKLGRLATGLPTENPNQANPSEQAPSSMDLTFAANLKKIYGEKKTPSEGAA